MGHKRKPRRAAKHASKTVWHSAKESARVFVDKFTGRDLDSKDARAVSPVKDGKGRKAIVCHIGPTLIGAYRDMELWAGARNEKWGHDNGQWALVVDLTGMTREPTVIVSPEADKLMGGKFRPREREPLISIDWPDGGVPWELGASDWDSLTAALGEITGKVFIHCLGGHGRTGTAVAILADKMGMIPAGLDPVAWVREKYCDDAVETAGQIRYIERITGRKVTAEESDSGRYRKWDTAQQNWIDATKPATTVNGQHVLPIGPVPTGNVAAGTTLIGKPVNNELWTFIQDGQYKVYRDGRAFLVSTNAAGDITSTRELDKATAGYDTKPLINSGYTATEGNPSDD